MGNAFQIKTEQEQERFCTLEGLSTLTPKVLALSLADAHWIVEGDEGIQARCSLWWRNAPRLSAEHIGLIGHYAACNAEAALDLLQLACKELTRQGCTLAIGPMDGNTYQRYRLLSERSSEPAFFLEPDNPDDWPDHFKRSGFITLANYYSALQTGFTWDEQRLLALTEQFVAEGVTLRQFDVDRFEDELRRIYRLVAISFRDSFLASPLGEEDFLYQYRRLRSYIQPELIQLAEREGELAGLIFSVPDWFQAQRGATLDTIVVKTLAVHPAYSGRGLGTLLFEHLSQIAHRLGYKRAIHALMHEKNISRHISQVYQGKIIRRYTLYAKVLGGEL